LTIDASIRIKDTYIGVNTDGNGEFEIAVQKGTVLEMSCLGYYKNQEKRTDNNQIERYWRDALIASSSIYSVTTYDGKLLEDAKAEPHSPEFIFGRRKRFCIFAEI